MLCAVPGSPAGAHSVEVVVVPAVAVRRQALADVGGLGEDCGDAVIDIDLCLALGH